ncbi:hypothetical protein QCA50_018408 [Cerrena zonata]|uniref:Uncharacterized protein n=1 Tax=Cerrena zonata TaxID=2478898 RepID=A0AAW0FD39_9APHY
MKHLTTPQKDYGLYLTDLLHRKLFTIDRSADEIWQLSLEDHDMHLIDNTLNSQRNRGYYAHVHNVCRRFADFLTCLTANKPATIDTAADEIRKLSPEHMHLIADTLDLQRNREISTDWLHTHDYDVHDALTWQATLFSCTLVCHH